MDEILTVVFIIILGFLLDQLSIQQAYRCIAEILTICTLCNSVTMMSLCLS